MTIHIPDWLLWMAGGAGCVVGIAVIALIIFFIWIAGQLG
jgi:hypothetical protein